MSLTNFNCGNRSHAMMNPFAMMEQMMGGMMGGGMFDMFGGHHGHGNNTGSMSQMTFSSGGGPGQFVSQSYSYTQELGPDGRPVIRESQHHVVNDGRHKEERYEHYDGARGRREAGLARAIDDRSVAVRKVARDTDPDDVETHTAFNNLDERELGEFDQQWQQSTGQSHLFRHSSQLPRSAVEWRGSRDVCVQPSSTVPRIRSSL